MLKCPFCGSAWHRTRFCADCGKDLSNYSYAEAKNAADAIADALRIFEVEKLPSGNYKVLRLKAEYENTVTNLVIPDCVEEIEKNAFRYMPQSSGWGAARGPKYLTGVEIGNGVRIIGENAFDGCKDLMSVKLGSGLQFIEPMAFANCHALQEVTIPKNVIKVGQAAFYGCRRLKRLTIEKGVKIVAQRAFSGCALKIVVVPAGMIYESDSFGNKRMLIKRLW